MGARIFLKDGLYTLATKFVTALIQELILKSIGTQGTICICNERYSAIIPTLDDPAIRNANRPESIRRKKTIFITSERFARIASDLRSASF